MTVAIGWLLTDGWQRSMTYHAGAAYWDRCFRKLGKAGERVDRPRTHREPIPDERVVPIPLAA